MKLLGNTSAKNKTIVLLGNSVRALAQSAHRLGFQVIVIDLFADADTISVAEQAFRICDSSGFRMNPVRLQQIIDDLTERYPNGYALWSSGIESYMDIIESNPAWHWLNCAPTVVRQVRDFYQLTRFLNEHQIPYPESSWSTQIDTTGARWLYKQNYASGGQGITRWHARKALSDGYLQKEYSGVPLSALVLAEQNRWHLIGFNRQLSTVGTSRPYLYCGALAGIDLDKEINDKIISYIDILIEHFNFSGLLGFDFIMCGKECFLLEINPRPTATVELYDRMLPSGNLLERHMNACLGHYQEGCSAPSYPSDQISGTRIAYAKRGFIVSAAVEWPEWSADRPQAGTRLQAGWPICSVFALGKDERHVEHELLKRIRAIEDLLSQ